MRSGLRVHWTVGRHPTSTGAWFWGRLDGLLHPAVLSTFAPDCWWSILLEDSRSAWLHVVAPELIPGTCQSAAVPWWHYAGTLLHSPRPDFLRNAVDLYRAEAPGWGLATEVVRLDPLDEYTPTLLRAMGGDPNSRRIVQAQVAGNDEEQLHSYASGARRQVIRARRELTVSTPDQADDQVWTEVAILHERSMAALGASERWRRLHRRFTMLRTAPGVRLWAVRAHEEIVAAAIGILDGCVGHCVLVAGGTGGRVRGSNDLLMHTVIRGFAAEGVTRVCLGGGRVVSDTDSLLRFKAKFGVLHPLPVAVLVWPPLERPSR